VNWIHAFEILCCTLTAILLCDLVRSKDIAGLKLFLSGALAGFALELLAVRVTVSLSNVPGISRNPPVVTRACRGEVGTSEVLL
jgi:hypothetical protein